MINTVTEFEGLLDELDPEASGFVRQADELVAQLSEAIAADVYRPIFRFFEKHPEAYCGSPGTLVHHVEQYYPNYVDALLASAKRKPSYNTAVMLNRILNSDITDLLRTQMLGLLGATSADSDVSQTVRDLAEWFVEHQAQRGSKQ